MKLLLIFIVLNIVNVILQTSKSIITIKCGTSAAAIANAFAYGLYTVVLVYMNCDLSLLAKVLIVAFTNFIGVYIVKFFENKLNKDKLWKIEVTIPTISVDAVDYDLRNIPHSYIKISDKHTLFNFYCSTRDETEKVKIIVGQYNAKYFISENKSTLPL